MRFYPYNERTRTKPNATFLVSMITNDLLGARNNGEDGWCGGEKEDEARQRDMFCRGIYTFEHRMQMDRGEKKERKKKSQLSFITIAVCDVPHPLRIDCRKHRHERAKR